MDAIYPRPLRAKERELLEAVLPPDRPGYRQYRELLDTTMVLGEGRRGAGNFILGPPGESPDLTAPLPPVIAYGVVVTTQDKYSITVRQTVDNQVDVEIISAHGEEIPDHFEEKWRWTYSNWQPGLPSPATTLPVREVRIEGSTTFVVDAAERRLWIYDERTGMNMPIPVTNFYNEVMVRKGIRDPRVALHPGYLFDNPDDFSDGELREAFASYNVFRHRVVLHDPPPLERRGVFSRVLSLFSRKA